VFQEPTDVDSWFPIIVGPNDEEASLTTLIAPSSTTSVFDPPCVYYFGSLTGLFLRPPFRIRVENLLMNNDSRAKYFLRLPAADRRLTEPRNYEASTDTFLPDGEVGNQFGSYSTRISTFISLHRTWRIGCWKWCFSYFNPRRQPQVCEKHIKNKTQQQY